jgi:sortase B
LRGLRKVVFFLDTISDKALFIFFIFLLFIGLYSIYDSYLLYKGSEDDSLLKYKYDYGEDNNDNRKILPSKVAWVTIDNTTIDYPVMQGQDNIEFLNKNPFGEYSLSGSIFLDCRNKSDFSDKYNLIYGHHMSNGGMFGVLDKYCKGNYLKTHNKGMLIVGDFCYDISLFCVFMADATDSTIFSLKNNTDILGYVEKIAIITDEELKKKSEDKKLIALSTCKYPDTTERTIVLGFLNNKRKLSKNNKETEMESKK